MRILVLNGGSSSLKGLLIETVTEPRPQGSGSLWEARVDWGHHPGQAEIRIRGAAAQPLETTLPIERPNDALEFVLGTLPAGRIDCVGHRVVHGGRAFRESTLITPAVKEAIAGLVQFAPEHNPLELDAIEAAERRLPGVPQVAVFDTAFHASLPEAASVYPGPYAWIEKEGIRRYGFHGISHQYVSGRAAELLGRPLAELRLITCHLGNGCSLAAILNGRSVDTTMGFTPLEGLMMGVRSGSIDPGILIYLVRHRGDTADTLDRILNRESGLLGVSGVSADMREILAAIETGNERARLAYDIFAHRLASSIAAMLASLGGLDALVFTAGIGENCPPIRETVCGRFAFLGLRLDKARNAANPIEADVAEPGSAIRVLVVHTDEDSQIARECAILLNKGAAQR